MAHFAKLDKNNIVVDIIAINNNELLDNNIESEAKGIEFINSIYPDETFNWKQTSYNNNFRKNYAGIGYTYDEKLDAFIPPKPYPSWILDSNTYMWQAPIPLPDAVNQYIWDDTIQQWQILQFPDFTKKPYDSWVLNKSTNTWEASTPLPDTVNQYIWDEPTLSWIEDPAK